jgi:hypothetical protein
MVLLVFTATFGFDNHFVARLALQKKKKGRRSVSFWLGRLVLLLPFRKQKPKSKGSNFWIVANLSDTEALFLTKIYVAL